MTIKPGDKFKTKQDLTNSEGQLLATEGTMLTVTGIVKFRNGDELVGFQDRDGAVVELFAKDLDTYTDPALPGDTDKPTLIDWARRIITHTGGLDSPENITAVVVMLAAIANEQRIVGRSEALAGTASMLRDALNKLPSNE